MFGALLSGCHPSPSTCLMDVLRCDDGDSVAIDASCDDATSPLQVQVGHGDRVLRTFADDHAPTLFSGAQGGTHVFVGARVQNADPQHPGWNLRWEIRAAQGEGCLATESCAAGWPVRASREVSLREGPPVEPAPGGGVEATGFLLEVSAGALVGARVSVHVVDACGREGTDVARIEGPRGGP